jgi:hypothetical protein
MHLSWCLQEALQAQEIMQPWGRGWPVCISCH